MPPYEVQGDLGNEDGDVCVNVQVVFGISFEESAQHTYVLLQCAIAVAFLTTQALNAWIASTQLGC